MKYRTGPLDCGGCKVQPPCSEQVKDPGTLVLSSSPKAATLMTEKQIFDPRYFSLSLEARKDQSSSSSPKAKGVCSFLALLPYSCLDLIGQGPMQGNLLYLVSVQSLSHVRLFETPWTAASQASLSITNSCSLLKFMSIELVMSSNHLILCHPLLLLPSIFPSNRVFSNESVLCIRWPKYWSFSFSISPLGLTGLGV